MNVYTFPLNCSFVDALAAHVLRIHGKDPLTLTKLMIVLPSRRASASLREAFLRLDHGAPMVLPRMQALGDMEETLPGEFMLGEIAEVVHALPPAIAPLKRQLLLTELVAADLRQMQGGMVDKSQAALLAKELMRLLDDMAREELDFSQLEKLVPEDLQEHWQHSVNFLNLIALHWPRMLAEAGVVEPLVRRAAILSALAEHWRRTPPQFPIIAAGSTGSQPATRRLLKVIAGLPQGSVILPGLDLALPHTAWETVNPPHPQYGMKQLLRTFNIERSQVKQLDTTVAASCTEERVSALRLAMLPAPAIAQGWENATVSLPEVEYAACNTLPEEARVIALRLRGVLEHPGKTAALVTANRQLARLTAAELRRLHVTIDDSAGKPLLDTPAAIFLRLLAEAALVDMAPVPLLALLKHPLCSAGMRPEVCRQAARLLEREQLRGVRLAAGMGALQRHAKSPETRALIGNVEAAMSPLLHIVHRRQVRFAALLEAHLKAAEALGQGTALYNGVDGQALAQALADLRAHAHTLGEIVPAHYVNILDVLLGSAMYRAPRGEHPRLHILSPIEARLQHYDVLILGGLNEGSWPQVPEPSPWMSRTMRMAFGLPPLEQAVGLSAHDVWMLMSAPEILLTRAVKDEIGPTTPSRWILRVEALLKKSGQAWQIPPELAWSRTARKATVLLAPLQPPAPCPPVTARPRVMSVTKLETWQRDPYAIYAQYILGLKPLEPLDAEASSSEFGNSIHQALERFVQAYPRVLPPDAEEQLLACGKEAFARYNDQPAVRAYWWPRFAAAVPWIIRQEIARRPYLREIQAEYKASLTLNGPAGAFVLNTRLDRLEYGKDGRITVVDYKSSELPATKDTDRLIHLQLPLSAAAVRAGAEVKQLAFWRLAANRSEEKVIKEGEEAKLYIEQALERVQQLIMVYDDPYTPYKVAPEADLAPHYNDYKHLERQEEWET